MGICTIDGKITPFLADTGATTSVIPEILSTEANLRKFNSRAITASGEEMRISGVRDCSIQLGNITNSASLLVSPEAQNELLLGLDYLSTCEITKPHIDGLRAVIKERQNNLKKEMNLMNYHSIKLKR